MTITIGRCVLPDPTSVSASGDTVTLGGTYYSSAATAAARAAVAQVRQSQLMGMVDNPDEAVFPVYWTVEARWDGYYTVDSASWSWVNDGSARLATANWSITLKRVLDGPNALVEMTFLSFVRTNGHSLTTATNNDVLAHATTYADYELRFLPDSSVVRKSPDADILVWLNNTSTAATGSIGLVYEPDDFYDTSCVIEYKAPDDVWYPVVGRDIPADAAGRWRLTNGCLRLEPSGTVGTLTLSVYNGSAWESVDFIGNAYLSATHLALKLASTNSAWLTPAITRNGPDGVALSTSAYTDNSGTTVRYNLSLALTRGTHHCEIVIQGGNGYPGLRIAAATASTALATSTAGLRATSNDANGNRIVLMSALAVTNDLTDGRFYVNSSSKVARAFAAGIELDGSSAATGNASAALLGQFIGISNIETHVVKR